jgi:hypothetical protein
VIVVASAGATSWNKHTRNTRELARLRYYSIRPMKSVEDLVQIKIKLN